jgi:hypothetical protein
MPSATEKGFCAAHAYTKYPTLTRISHSAVHYVSTMRITLASAIVVVMLALAAVVHAAPVALPKQKPPRPPSAEKGKHPVDRCVL